METQTETVFCTDRHKTELADLVQKIRMAAKDAVESSHDALKSAIAAGGYLTKAKNKVLHGKWIPWMKENFSFSHSTANNWMRLWDNRKDLIELIESSPNELLTVTSALRLVSANPSPPPKTKLEMVKKRCRDLIREIHDQSPSEARRSRDTLEEHVEDVSNFIEKYTK